MAPNQSARKNHEVLFAHHTATLALTDPELLNIFERFAFDEIRQHSDLDLRLRLMTQLAALIACQALGEYPIILESALNIGITPIEAKEILYQSVPYVGMAKVFDFIDATNKILTERGISLPLENQSTTTPENRLEQGLRVQKQIIGTALVDKFYATAPKDQQHIQKYLSANCFGDYYTRTGIDLATRELVILSLLVALGGCETQLKGHISANLNMGNSRTVLIDVVTQLLPFIGYPRTLNALRAIDEVIPNPE